LLGWWPGDGNLNDIFGGSNGTAQGGLTATAPGFVGQAMTFDGTNGYVTVPDSALWHPSNLTVECWVRFTGLDSPGTAAAGQTYIVFKQNTRSSTFEGFTLYKSRLTGPTRDVFTFGVSSAAGAAIEVFSTTTISTGVWYHVAGVRGSNFAQIYVNGQLQNQLPVTFPQDYGVLPLNFGTTGQPAWDRKLQGQLDEVAIFNRALASNEIAAVYAAGAFGKCKTVSITAQPQSRTNVLGTTANFNVIAAGSPPLSYQWLFNGENIPGASATNLVVASIQSTNAGNYTVVVTDSASASITSAVAVLTVLLPPTFTATPANATNDAGTTAQFSALVAGSAPITYRWQYNSVNLTNGGRFTGVTTDTLTITIVLPTDAGNYRVVASNAAGTNISPAAILIVTGPPSIQTQPASQSVVSGNAANFSVAASGTQPLSYQWQRNGVDLSDSTNILGATTSALTLTGVTTNDAGTYRVVLTNTAGALTSQVANLTVNVPPGITVQPTSQTALFGTNVQFSVVAIGTAPLRYQWRFNGTNIVNSTAFSGATNTILSLNYVLPANAGGYSVVVTNPYGSITSSVATLTVQPPTNCYSPPPGLIGWWPGDGNAKDIVGTNNGNFSNGVVSVPGLLGNAMKFDGTNSYMAIPDSPQLHLPVLSVECWVYFTSLNGEGNSSLPGQQYMVFKSNSRTCNNFEAFVLSKDRDPDGDAFLWEVTSADGNLIRSDSKTRVTTNTWYHVVGVAGTNYLEMYVNGVMETNVTFNFPLDYGNNKPLMFGSSGESCYDRKLHGLLDEVALYNRPLNSNEVAALYLNGLAGKCKGTNGIVLTLQPQDQIVHAGTNVTFTSAAVGGSAIGYQWQRNGSPIAGATSSTLIVTNVQAGGSYRVVVTNGSGTLTSASATLTVLFGPTITVPPTNQTVVAGNSAQFSVIASGEGTLTYQWRFQGTDLLGETNATLLLPAVQPAQAGGYSVVVFHASGLTISPVAILTVLMPPYIINQPTNQTKAIGRTATFKVVAGGDGALSYQWLFNGSELEGAVADTLTLFNVQPGQAGGYSVVVSNAYGTTSSVPAILTVLIPPYIVTQPASKSVPFGSSAIFAVVAGGTGPLSYQWKFFGTNLPGENADSLTILNAQPEKAGPYSVFINAPGGSTNSAIASLATYPNNPVLLGPNGSPNSSFAFILSGDAGHNYAIEITTNFQDWTELTTITNETGQAQFSDYATSNSVSRFYRARFTQ
jgi:hypothetical protein